MKFIYIDLIFLALFVIFVSAFLYIKRKNVQVESKIFLIYRTKVGIKIIKKLSKILPLTFLSDIAIFCGYLMMFTSIFLLYKVFEMMISSVILVNIPPVIPLIPYLPEIFKLTFLPPFYFTYWIISILIIAVSHEFSHGIFANFYKINLKSTGFGFLGPFLAAFVEVDEKANNKAIDKKKYKSQLAILSGGPFANLVMTVLFLLLMNGFFSLAYAPSGINYIYAANNISLSSIDRMNEINVIPSQIISALNKFNDTNASIRFSANGTKYILTLEILQTQKKIINISQQLFVYYDSPAYRSNLSGPIIKIQNEKIDSIEALNKTLSKLQPSQKINVETLEKNYSITLDSDPTNSSKPFLGVSFYTLKESLLSKFLKVFIEGRKDSFVYYAPKLDSIWGNIIIFIYNLLFWIIMINLSVALFNMLPLSVFDGGKFFQITMLKLTNDKKKAMKLFRIVSGLIGGFIALITAIWFVRWIF